MDLHSQLAAPFYVLGHRVNDADATPQGQAQISIQHWSRDDGATYIPFFSALEFLQQAAPGDEAYLQMSARDLMTITAGSLLIVNPRSDLEQELTPELVLQMLATPPASPPTPTSPMATEPSLLSPTADVLRSAGSKLRGMLGLKKR